MRWDELFADIEGQLEQELDAERLEVAAEDERLRLGRLALGERLEKMSRDSGSVKLVLADAQILELRIESAGADWVAGEPSHGAGGRGVIVPLAALAAALPGDDRDPRPAPGAAHPPPGNLVSRFRLAFVLRDLCRRRIVVDVRTSDGSHHGTIDRVGADHLDLAEHDLGEPRRQRAVRRVRLVPFAAIICVHT